MRIERVWLDNSYYKGVTLIIKAICEHYEQFYFLKVAETTYI